MIITKTPFRVSFFGGGTDYPDWFEANDGLVLAASIDQYCYISVRKLPPFFDYKSRVVYSRIEEVNNHGDIVHPAIRSCLEHMGIEEGLEIHYDADLPGRTGIGSSSSFTAGFLLALNGLRRRMMTPHELAEKAIELEQDVMREDVGIQDQIMAAFGGFNAIQMSKGERFRIDPIILPDQYRQSFEQHVLLAFTGISRYATDFARSQIENIRSGAATQHLERIQSLAHQARKLFVDRASMQDIGQLLHESWSLKRRIAEGISNDFIDQLYDRAMKAGAYGGKILGAGGGGFLMLVAPPERHPAIRSELQELKVWIPFEISRSGSQVIFLDLDTDSNVTAP